MSERRAGQRSAGPAGGRRPGRPGRPGRTVREGRRGAGRTATRSGADTGEPAATRRRRPRLTGRAAVLVLVLSVLAVSYASSLKAYLVQRAHIAELKSEIARTSAQIDDLEREKRRWHDDAFVKMQARERFGYVMPGETAYVVLDEHGKPVESRAELHDPDEVLAEPPTAWWQDAWESVELAGDPPRHQPPPATELGASKG